MSDERNEAFNNGREDGFAAGLTGAARPPDPDAVKALADPEFEKQYRQSAALDFARGRERKELVLARAMQQIEDRDR
jgi:hypothetical protein